MTYSTELNKSNRIGNFLIKISPRVKISSWTQDPMNGYIWYTSFTYGVCNSFFGETSLATLSKPDNGVFYTEVSSYASISGEGQFFYDESAQRLYIGYFSNVDPPDDDEAFATYELYFSTEEVTTYRDPLDNTTSVKYWEPRIIKNPVLSQSLSDLMAGFIPYTVSSIELANGDGYFWDIIYDRVFHNCSIDIWHYFDELSTSNMRKVFWGFIEDFSCDNSSISFKTKDILSKLDKEFSDKFLVLTSVNIPNPEPGATDWFIRKVYGRVDYFRPINIDYSDTPSTSNNRDWIVKQGTSNLNTVVRNIDDGGTNDGTTTTLTSIQGINIGDWVRLSDSGVNYVRVTNVDENTLQITHADIGSRTGLTSATCTRFWLSAVYIIDTDNGNTVTHVSPTDYTLSGVVISSTESYMTIVLDDNFEASYSLSNTTFDPSVHLLRLRVYGDDDIPNYAVSGTPIGTVDPFIGTVTNGAMILYKILTDGGLFERSEMHDGLFSEAIDDDYFNVGFTVPETFDGSWPTYKEVVLKLLRSSLLTMYISNLTNEVKLGVKQFKPMGSADFSVTEEEYNLDSFDFDYTDIYRDIYITGSAYDNLPDDVVSSLSIDNDGIGGNPNGYILDKYSDFSVDTYMPLANDLSEYALKLSYLFSDRRGKLKITGYGRLYTVEIGQILQINAKGIPGFEFDEDTVQNRKYIVTETSKGLNGITITLEDQKGIEDNSGSW